MEEEMFTGEKTNGILHIKDEMTNAKNQAKKEFNLSDDKFAQSIFEKMKKDALQKTSDIMNKINGANTDSILKNKKKKSSATKKKKVQFGGDVDDNESAVKPKKKKRSGGDLHLNSVYAQALNSVNVNKRYTLDPVTLQHVNKKTGKAYKSKEVDLDGYSSGGEFAVDEKDVLHKIEKKEKLKAKYFIDDDLASDYDESKDIEHLTYMSEELSDEEGIDTSNIIDYDGDKKLKIGRKLTRGFHKLNAEIEFDDTVKSKRAHRSKGRKLKSDSSDSNEEDSDSNSDSDSDTDSDSDSDSSSTESKNYSYESDKDDDNDEKDGDLCWMKDINVKSKEPTEEEFNEIQKEFKRYLVCLAKQITDPDGYKKSPSVHIVNTQIQNLVQICSEILKAIIFCNDPNSKPGSITQIQSIEPENTFIGPSTEYTFETLKSFFSKYITHCNGCEVEPVLAKKSTVCIFSVNVDDCPTPKKYQQVNISYLETKKNGKKIQKTKSVVMCSTMARLINSITYLKLFKDINIQFCEEYAQQTYDEMTDDEEDKTVFPTEHFKKTVAKILQDKDYIKNTMEDLRNTLSYFMGIIPEVTSLKIKHNILKYYGIIKEQESSDGKDANKPNNFNIDEKTIDYWFFKNISVPVPSAKKKSAKSSEMSKKDAEKKRKEKEEKQKEKEHKKLEKQKEKEEKKLQKQKAKEEKEREKKRAKEKKEKEKQEKKKKDKKRKRKNTTLDEKIEKLEKKQKKQYQDIVGNINDDEKDQQQNVIVVEEDEEDDILM